MSSSNPEVLRSLSLESADRSAQGLLVRALAPARVVLRFLGMVGWIALCYLAALAAAGLTMVAKEQGARLRKQVARTWIRGVCWLIGMRIRQVGEVPAKPYFMTINHISWIDLFVMYYLCDFVGVLQEEDERIPFLGRILRGLNPVFVKRKRENLPRGQALIVEAMAKEENIILAPEGVVGPGREVRRFRAGFLQAPVELNKPVHYTAITTRAPKGWRPASKSVLYGPDPFYRDEQGNIPQSELEAWGPEKNFLWHLFGMLALPWFEVTVTFAPEPIWAADRHTLAQELQAATERIFVRVD